MRRRFSSLSLTAHIHSSFVNVMSGSFVLAASYGIHAETISHTGRFGNRLARATGSDTCHWNINNVKASMRQMKYWKNFALLPKKFEIFCARRCNQLQQNKEIVRIIPLTIISDTHLLTIYNTETAEELHETRHHSEDSLPESVAHTQGPLITKTTSDETDNKSE